MSRRHNVAKTRATGGYARRLKKRGLSRAPKMPDLKTLRRMHGVPLEVWEV